MTEELENNKKKRALWVRLLPVAVLVSGLVLAVSLGWHRYLSLESLAEHRGWLNDSVALYGVKAIIGFVLLYALATAFSVPGGVFLTIGAGFLFGAVPATSYVIVGATLGATGIFLAARTALGDLLKARAGAMIQKMEAGFQENELSYMLVLRLVPLFPFWLVNIVPAFLGVSLRTYVVATFFGIIPGTFVFALVGSRIGDVLDSFDPDDPPNLTTIIFQPENLLPILGLAALALIPVVYKAHKKRKDRHGRD